MAQLDLRLLAHRAYELGHRLDVERRDFEDYGVPSKFFVRCSCGYEARARRSEKAALEAGVFHLGKAVGEHGGIAEVKRVSVPQKRPEGRHSAAAG